MQFDIADEIVDKHCPEKSYVDQWILMTYKMT